MSKRKINAGDTLTVGDLTDAHLGAVIEVGPTDGGITCRFRLDRIECYGTSQVKMLTTEGGAKHADLGERVTVITPPPVVQPDEPTELGQLIRIEGDKDFRGVVADPGSDTPILVYRGCRCPWAAVLFRAGDRRIIVSDPPRWPDEAPVVPERIEAGEWPADDEHLSAYRWKDKCGDEWWWERHSWRVGSGTYTWGHPMGGPWTRGERVK